MTNGAQDIVKYMNRKHKIHLIWTCSAWLCGRFQRLLQELSMLLESKSSHITITFAVSYIITTIIMFILEGV
jgi:uncharacterized membrane protein required for colicin V production